MNTDCVFSQLWSFQPQAPLFGWEASATAQVVLTPPSGWPLAHWL
jgi:hypothetical protein